MTRLRVTGIFALLFLFLLIFVPFVDAQASSSESEEAVGENVRNSKAVQEAIKEGLKRAPEGATRLGEALESIDLEMIEGKDYLFDGEKAPEEDKTVTTGKDYIDEENGEDRAPPPTRAIIEGKDYASIFIAAGEGLEAYTPTDDIIFGKTYPFYGDVGRDTRTRGLTAAAYMGQMYTGKDYPSIVEKKPVETFSPYSFMGGTGTYQQGAYLQDQTVDTALNVATEKLGGIMAELNKILNVIMENSYIQYTILIFVFAALIGKMAGWQIGLIGGSAIAVVFASATTETLIPPFVVGVIVLGTAAMVSMALSKMTAG